ncbi:MAG: hypothetical protein K0S32_2318 [Bacteroidetes bacterium]|jgi:hypothetical protein|nr:hypothetical protein [Bacteroidota bacterium]
MENGPRLSHRGMLIAFLLGAPLGLLVIAALLAAIAYCVYMINPWLTFILLMYIGAVIWMCAAMILILLPIGRYIEWCVIKKQSLLRISLTSSFLVSLGMWLTFGLKNYYDIFQLFSFAGVDFFAEPLASNHFFLVPLIGFAVTFVLGTFTIAFLVCYVIRKRVNNALLKDSINNSFNFH